MNRKEIFLATPISGFSDESEYQNYRTKVLNFIEYLRDNSFDVYSQIERVTCKSNYDAPELSTNEDLKKIDDSNIFLLLHPKKMQTSTLIELGYAYAKKKIIIIISPSSALPYLAFGLPSSNTNIRIINSSDLDIETFSHVISAINCYLNP